MLWKTVAQAKDYFCILNCGNFYPFFMLGVFTSKYKLLEKLKRANWLFSLCLAVYAVLFCVDMPVHALVSLNKHIFLPFCMVVICVNLFLMRHDRNSLVERILDLMGRRTLDIYMIHYFFVSQIHFAHLGNYLETSGNSLLLFVLAFLASAVIAVLSMGIGEVLHKGRLIERFVYGK